MPCIRRLLGQEEQARQPQPEGVHISPVFSMTLLILTGIFIVSVSLVVAYRSSYARFDPFADYANVLPGQSIENVEAHGFECIFIDAHDGEECLLRPANGVFSRVAVAIDDGLVSSINFLPHRNALTVGDVALVLGTAQRTLLSSYAGREDGSHGYAVRYVGRFSYLQPVLYISLW